MDNIIEDKIIEKYLTKIVDEALTQPEITAIGKVIKEAFYRRPEYKSLALFVNGLSAGDITSSEKKAIAKLMLDELYDIWDARESNPSTMDDDTNTLAKDTEDF
jgi:hypothetical protein